MSDSDHTAVGEPFPPFELPDLAGRTWQRADLVGRRAVVFCFSTW